MLMDENDFLADIFEANEIKIIRKRITESILSTDMAGMKKLREEFQQQLDKFDIKDGVNGELLIDTKDAESIEYSKQLVTNVVLHACDISTSLRDFEVSTQWADLLFDEFFFQGDTEKSQSLEVSMMCNRDTTNISSG